MYCVIETRNSRGELEVCIASTNWIKGSKIYFPSSTSLQKHLHKHLEPGNEWLSYDFRILSDNIGTYIRYLKFTHMNNITMSIYCCCK